MVLTTRNASSANKLSDEEDYDIMEQRPPEKEETEESSNTADDNEEEDSPSAYLITNLEVRLHTAAINNNFIKH